MPTIGPTFALELGALTAQCSWDPNNGTIIYASGSTGTQQSDIAAALAAHNPATPHPNSEYQAALTAGVAITSTGDSALNATYAIDQVSWLMIASEVACIQATGGPASGKFTNGTSSKAWPDAAGNYHTFTTTQFIAFAEAVAGYVDALISARQTALAAHPWTWTAPAMPAAIA